MNKFNVSILISLSESNYELTTYLIYSPVMRVTDDLGSNPYLAGCISATSYVTLVFYTRTFSNSLESFFLSLLLVAVVEYVHLCRKAKLTAAMEKRKETNKSEGVATAAPENTEESASQSIDDVTVSNGTAASDSTTTTSTDDDSQSEITAALSLPSDSAAVKISKGDNSETSSQICVAVKIIKTQLTPYTALTGSQSVSSLNGFCESLRPNASSDAV